ncbi:MAG: GNAT family N-acetyltransferase [bacterium]
MENLKAVKYNKYWQKKWDEFVASSCNGTIFHCQKFLSYHSSEKFKDFSLLLSESGQIKSVFPAAAKEIEGKRYFFSHPGSSYGGLVVNENISIAEAFEYLKIVIDFAKKNSFDGIIIRHSERIFQKSPAEVLDFAMTWLGFGYYARELSSSVDLARFNFNKKARNAVRKAEKLGLTGSLSQDYDGFFKLLCDNLAKKHNSLPTHSLEEMKKIKNLFPEDVFLMSVFLKEKMIAGIWFFRCNEVGLHTFYIAQDYDFQEYRPLNLAAQELIRWAIEKKLRYLNFGISTEEKGKVINWNLFKFKESFGAFGTRRDAYILNF